MPYRSKTGNPKSNYLAHKDKIDAAIKRVLSGGRYILGEEVTALEKEFAQYVGVRFGIGVASGTEALCIALRACRIGIGDEVITVAHTANNHTAQVDGIVSGSCIHGQFHRRSE